MDKIQKQIDLIRKQIELLVLQISLLTKSRSKRNIRMWIYNVAKSHLGVDVARHEDEFGCAEAVNEIVRRATGKPAGGGTSTTSLFNALKQSKIWKRVSSKEAKEGDIVISPTGMGESRGHTGICGDDGKIMSNNSKTFLWDDHLDRDKWMNEYSKKRNFPIFYFRYIG